MSVLLAELGRTRQGRVHVHGAEFVQAEYQVVQRLFVLVWVVREQELCHIPGESARALV